MGDRAVRPLLLELRKAVGGGQPDPDAEKAILGVLKAVAPDLTGYDAAAPADAKLKTIDEWLGES